MNPELYNPHRRVVFFPVRHHSPACARLVNALAHQMQPAAILIEGPADFNEQMTELFLPHQLPIAIYSYVKLADEAALNGRRRGVFYPFSIYSPEWQAIQTGQSLGAVVRFIDLPLAHLPHPEHELATHRYADGSLSRSQYVNQLFAQMGVETFDDLWDTLFEIDDQLDVPTYLQQAHYFCYHIRQTAVYIEASNDAREAYMAAQIRQAMAQTNGRILVVTGGFHSAALFELTQTTDTQTADSPTPEETPPPVAEQGIALTPYTYQRLDNLTGYEAGMPNPGYYHHVWQDRQTGTADTHRKLLGMVATMLRHRGQVVSAADLIAVETTARALATLRGHAHVWRRDLIDGIISSLVKEEMAYGFRHAFLDALFEVFRGTARGKLAAGTSLPPFVLQLQALLAHHNLEPGTKVQTIRLDLSQSADLTRSRILHQIRVLALPGFSQQSGGDLIDTESLHEQWRILWRPEFEGACIEAAVYGPTLMDAATARLQERAQAIDRPDAAQAALILLDGALMGLPETAAFYQTLATLIHQDSNFFTVTQALARLLYLYRFDEVLGTGQQADVGHLLQTAFQRGLWLLESLGTITDGSQKLLAGVRALLETFERCGPLSQAVLETTMAEFTAVFTRISQDTGQTPLLRGAVSGVLWTLGQASAADMMRDIRYFADPEQLGDFLTGLFYLARETIQREPALAQSIDDLLISYDEEAFLAALPALRLAFSFFTPREKHYIAEALFDTQGMAAETANLLTPFTVDIRQVTQVLAFEAALFQVMEQYGITMPGNQKDNSHE